MTRYSTDWLAAGACLEEDPDLFYPVATGVVGARQAGEAQQICARCRVRRECLEFAINSYETHGVWGGTTPEERVRLRRQRSDARRRGRQRQEAGAA